MDHRSPDGRHNPVFEYAGEFHWGPAYFRLKLNGKAFADRLFDFGMGWSDDSRFFAVQEWLSTDYRRGPVCRVLIFDTHREKYCLLKTVGNGSVTDFRFMGHVFHYTIKRSAGGRQETSEEKEDLSGRVDWKPMVYGPPRGEAPPLKKTAPKMPPPAPIVDGLKKEKLIKWWLIYAAAAWSPFLLFLHDDSGCEGEGHAGPGYLGKGISFISCWGRLQQHMDKRKTGNSIQGTFDCGAIRHSIQTGSGEDTGFRNLIQEIGQLAFRRD